MNSHNAAQQDRLYGMEARGLYYSFYDGVVEANDAGGAQLSIRCAALYGNEIVEEVLPFPSLFGNNAGIFYLPKVGDKVYIVCQIGDANNPRWVYGDNPPPTEGNAEILVIKSNDGSIITLHKDKILITPAGGQTIEINETGISLGSAGGSAEQGVLGNTLASLLNSNFGNQTSLVNILVTMVSGLVAANSSIPLTAHQNPVLTPVLSSLQALASQIQQDIVDVNSILSNVVTLD